MFINDLFCKNHKLKKKYMAAGMNSIYDDGEDVMYHHINCIELEEPISDLEEYLGKSPDDISEDWDSLVTSYIRPGCNIPAMCIGGDIFYFYYFLSSDVKPEVKMQMIRLWRRGLKETERAYNFILEDLSDDERLLLEIDET